MGKKSKKSLRFALLLENGSELLSATLAIRYCLNHNHEVLVISPKGDHIRTWNRDNWGDMLTVNESTPKDSEGFDVLVIPGGVASALKLRSDRRTVVFVRSFLSQKKILIAENYAIQVLLESPSIKNHEVTSPEPIKTDVENAGCKWSGDFICFDGNLVTCQESVDLGKVLQQLTPARKKVDKVKPMTLK